METMVKKNGLTVNWRIMKKLFYLAAVAAAFLFASCTKAEPESAVETVKKFPTLDIAVSNFEGKVDDGVSTRAIKTGWVAGDKVNIWFDDGTYKYGTDFPSKDEHFYPELIMTYNGSTWDYEFSSFFDKTLLKTARTGKLIAVYESRNDIRKTFYQPSTYVGSAELFGNYSTSVSATNSYMTPMIVYAYSLYTYDSDADKISASLEVWQFLTKIQIYITGLTMDESYYTLICQSDADNPDAVGKLSRVQGLRLSSKGVVYPYGESSSYGVGGGTMGTDGMAFYFSDAVSSGEAKNYKFRLGYLNGRAWTYGYAQFDNKVITTSPTTLKCIKIDKSQFSNSLIK